MSDLSATVIPKSDQINADDLIAGPLTITVTKVLVRLGEDQPTSIHFEGDAGKAFRPCKSMRRVLILAWGADSAVYIGRSMTLYRDPKVKWGGQEVGGIRISHVSNIERDLVVALTETKGKRAPFVVKPLAVKVDKVANGVRDLIARINAAADMPALQVVTADPATIKSRTWLATNRPDLAAQVDEVVANALALLAPDDDAFPGDTPSAEAA
jgi:hypothetical protein